MSVFITGSNTSNIDPGTIAANRALYIVQT